MCNWSKRVVIKGEESKAVAVTSSVPQGSVLRLILFLPFIDDLPEYTIFSQIQIFADDTIVFITISSIDDWNILHNDLKKIEQ